jgi:hypothetical protein
VWLQISQNYFRKAGASGDGKKGLNEILILFNGNYS